MTHEDRIILKMKREYTNDEKLGLLFQKLKNTEIELGITKSERDEYKDKVKSLQVHINFLEAKMTRKNIKKKNEEIEKLKEENEKLTNLLTYYKHNE